MDYAVDILNRNVETNIGPQFIYDDRRFFFENICVIEINWTCCLYDNTHDVRCT